MLYIIFENKTNATNNNQYLVESSVFIKLHLQNKVNTA